MKHNLALSLFLCTGILATSANAGWLDNLAAAQAKTEKVTTTATATQSNDLVGSVMSQLGLNQRQAEGG
ncbi:MAG: DUF2780 domain-containing protein, partial [Shewanella sp.]